MNRRTFDYVVVVPAYNEAGMIHAVVARALKYLDRIVVVDDGSTDRTADCLRELPVTILRHPHNLGKAAALWHGMQHAMQQGATAVITLDADGQHEPSDIPALIDVHRCDPSAIVIGARLHASRIIPWPRYLANLTALVTNGLGDRLRSIGVGTPLDDDIETGLPQRQTDGTTDVTAPAGYQRPFHHAGSSVDRGPAVWALAIDIITDSRPVTTALPSPIIRTS